MVEKARKDWMDNYVYIYFLGKIGGFGGLVRGKGRGGGGLIRFLEISRREYGNDWDGNGRFLEISPD